MNATRKPKNRVLTMADTLTNAVDDNGGTRSGSIPTSTLAFIYWRYAIRERPMAEERQVEDCTAYATRIGRPVGGIFGDAGKSGASMSTRTGLHDMMAQVREHRPKLVIVENCERLARRLADLMVIYNELAALDVELHDVMNGRLDLPQVFIRGRIFCEAFGVHRSVAARDRRVHWPPRGLRRERTTRHECPPTTHQSNPIPNDD